MLMKAIGIIAHSLDKKGGIERVIQLKTSALAKKYSCSLILMYNLGTFSYNLNQNLNIYFLNNKLEKIRKILIHNILKLKYLIEKNNIKVIIIEGRPVTCIPFFLKLFSNIKIIFCEHGSLAGYTMNCSSKREIVFNFIDQFFIKNFSDKIITLTERERTEYIKRFKIKSEKIATIYNILDDNLLIDKPKYSIESRKIITVGRISYSKGYEYLIEVAKSVFKKHPDWQWHIYGDGDIDYKNKIVELIKINNLENYVLLQGSTSNIYDLYNKYSFLVMSSRHEGFGMVLIEAKAKKLPLISFDINSGPSDIIRDGIDGFLIKPFDCNEMADKICELIEKPELRKIFSDNAYGNIAKFNRDKIISQWSDLIENITNK